MNGHCDLMKKIQSNELCEKDDDPYDHVNGLLKQTLEFDADCCAAASLINEDIRSYIMGLTAAGLNDSHIAGCYESFTNFICGVVVSLYTLYQTIDSAVIHPSYYKESDLILRKHPLAGMRIIYIIMNISTAISGWNIFDKDQISNIESEALNTPFMFIDIFKDSVPPQFMKEVIANTEYMNHIQKLHDNWGVVVKLLDANYIKLAPYSKVDFRVGLDR